MATSTNTQCITHICFLVTAITERRIVRLTSTNRIIQGTLKQPYLRWVTQGALKQTCSLLRLTTAPRGSGVVPVCGNYTVELGSRIQNCARTVDGNNTLCSSAVSSQAYGLNDSSIASLADTHNIHRAGGSTDTKCARTDPAYECCRPGLTRPHLYLATERSLALCSTA